jgi:hypothetical protein
MMDEAVAASHLRRISQSGRAAEFMEKVAFGSGMYTWQPDGSLLILDDEQTKSMLEQLGGT